MAKRKLQCAFTQGSLVQNFKVLNPLHFLNYLKLTRLNYARNICITQRW